MEAFAIGNEMIWSKISLTDSATTWHINTVVSVEEVPLNSITTVTVIVSKRELGASGIDGITGRTFGVGLPFGVGSLFGVGVALVGATTGTVGTATGAKVGMAVGLLVALA